MNASHEQSSHNPIATDSLQEQGSRPQDYPRWMKVGVVILCIGVVIVWGGQLRRRLVLTLPKLGDDTKSLVENLQDDFQELSDEQLRSQDSDLDGLNDYDEINVHSTSPFIADTDSDGIADPDELAAGTDPTCAEGADCSAGFTSGDVATEQPTLNQQPATSDELQALLNDPVRLRQLLLEEGADPALISQLDDQTIQLLGQQAFSDLTEPTQQKKDILQNFTPEQIRGLLASVGMEQTEIDKLTDEELEEIYQQVLLEEGLGAVEPTT